jgi:membrane-associated phospholipid phosphatase
MSSPRVCPIWSRMVAAAAVAVALLAAATPARAEDDGALRYDLRYDLPILIGGIGFWTVTEVFAGSLRPAECRWCAHNSLDDSVKDALVWDKITRATRLSDTTAFVLSPLNAIGTVAVLALRDGRGDNYAVDAMIVLESAAITSDITQIVKWIAARERPAQQDNMSFFSGHTSVAFSLAVSGGMVATLRGYRGDKIVWGIGLAGATTTAYLRIAGDKHYFTDVLTGALVGSAVGVLVPYLHRGHRIDGPPGRLLPAPSVEGLSASLTADGGIVSISGRWW